MMEVGDKSSRTSEGPFDLVRRFHLAVLKHDFGLKLVPFKHGHTSRGLLHEPLKGVPELVLIRIVAIEKNNHVLHTPKLITAHTALIRIRKARKNEEEENNFHGRKYVTGKEP